MRVARTIKDRVSRALNGLKISTETLGWFFGAFEMTTEDQEKVWAAFYGLDQDCISVSNTLIRHRSMISPQHHRTISLFERYVVSDKRLTLRKTSHTISAVADRVDRYIFNHEQAATRIKVVHGGTLGHQHEYGDGLRAAEIVFDRPLRKSQGICLEYETHFEGTSDLITEVRRAAYARATNVDIAVEFHSRRPTHAWWCAWDDHLEGTPVQETPVTIRQSTVHHYFAYIENTVIGFRWEW
jgi:hypothetical protein